ncbi:protein kinase [candidate division CSSED10-310 bacterium]|uniref:Protein kinase n=1 Tax=candidate division CSSED10-310 bacterium TaxID=2855610 RepID=A0ABV6Z5J0_UNCC1
MKLGKDGRYLVLEELGHVGESAVYKVRDTITDRNLAIKLIPIEITANSNALKKLRDEFKIISHLDHSNIIIAHHFEDTTDSCFYTMDFIAEGTLADALRIEDKGRFSRERTLNIARQTAAALDHAHSRKFKDKRGKIVNGILHRSLRPEKILLAAGDNVKVYDFGVSELIMATTLTLSDSSLKSELLSLPYMAPEQYYDQDCDHHIDIFAFGVIVYEMLTGKLPFPEKGLRFENRDIEIEKVPGFSANQHKAMQKVLAFEKEERYDTASEFVADLERTSRKKNWFFSMSIVALLLALAVFGSLFLSQEKPDQIYDSLPAAVSDLGKKLARSYSGDVRNVAVLGFSNSDGLFKEQWIDMLQDELMVHGKLNSVLQFVEREKISLVLKERNLVELGLNEEEKLEIGKGVNADAILTGNIRLYGDHFTIYARLFETSRRTQIAEGAVKINKSSLPREILTHQTLPDKTSAQQSKDSDSTTGVNKTPVPTDTPVSSERTPLKTSARSPELPILSAETELKKDWQNTAAIRTIIAYETFIEKYDNNPIAANEVSKAKKGLQLLILEERWQDIVKVNDSKSYQVFINYYELEPAAASYVAQAKERLHMRLEWQEIEQINNTKTFKNFINKYRSLEYAAGEVTLAQERLLALYEKTIRNLERHLENIDSIPVKNRKGMKKFCEMFIDDYAADPRATDVVKRAQKILTACDNHK